MKNFTKLLIGLLLSLTLFSCSQDEPISKNEYIYKSEKINFTKFIDETIGVNNSQKKSSDSEKLLLQSVFKTNLNIPSNLTKKERKQYIIDNQKNINGKLEYFINDEVFLKYEVVNGEIEKTVAKVFSKGLNEYPCAYRGIQKCTKDAIDNWHTITAIICAFTGGLECILEEAAICISANCFNY